VTIRIVLADDQALLRKGFRMILEAEDGIEIVGEAPDGADAVRLAELYSPDVVLMDVRMPVLDGIEATRAIVGADSGKSGPGDAHTRVLILTTFDLDEYAFSALRAGASGFLLKDVPPAELVAAIKTVARGDAVVSPRITRRLLEEYAHTLPDLAGVVSGAGAGPDGGTGTGSEPGAAEDPALASLTDREREVLLAVADGLSNAEIAERLYVSEATVKSHVGRLLAKLGLRDRVQAVVFAFQSGLVDPGVARHSAPGQHSAARHSAPAQHSAAQHWVPQATPHRETHTATHTSSTPSPAPVRPPRPPSPSA
jgi:DNA-binding NarL/FixJ family response regulator